MYIIGKNIGIDFRKTYYVVINVKVVVLLSKEHVKTCKTCNGQGKVMKMVQMGPMIQQSIQHCASCNGKGKMIDQGKQLYKM